MTCRAVTKRGYEEDRSAKRVNASPYAYGQSYPQSYQQSYQQPYGQPYGGQPYGQPYQQPYQQPYPQPYQQPYNPSYSQPYYQASYPSKPDNSGIASNPLFAQRRDDRPQQNSQPKRPFSFL